MNQIDCSYSCTGTDVNSESNRKLHYRDKAPEVNYEGRRAEVEERNFLWKQRQRQERNERRGRKNK
jgi:hypothetical protein